MGVDIERHHEIASEVAMLLLLLLRLRYHLHGVMRENTLWSPAEVYSLTAETRLCMEVLGIVAVLLYLPVPRMREHTIRRAKEKRCGIALSLAFALR